MSKAAKISLSIIALLLFLFVTTIILVTTLVDPNKFKTQISSAVQKHTGREFVIGDIKLSFLPWIGLRLQHLALGNAPGFNQQAFAKVGEADVNIRLLPLFVGQVNIGTVSLKDLALNLAVNNRGQNNWNDLVATGKGGVKDTKSKSNAGTTPSITNTNLPNLTISKVNISEASVNWNNQQTGQTATLDHLYFNSKNVNFNKPFPVKLKFHLTSNKPAVNTQIALASDVSLNPNDQRYALNNLNLNGILIGKQYPKGQVPFALQADVNANLKNQTLIAKNINASLANAKIAGNLSGNKIMQAPEFASNLTVPAFNLRNLLNSLGQKIQLADANALQTVSLKADAQFSPKYIKLTNLSANLDDTRLNGRLNFADFNNKNFDFDLQINQINLSRYLTAAANAQQQKDSNNPALHSTVSSNAAAASNLPVNLLRQLNGQGSLQISKLTIANITTNNLLTRISAKNGIINIAPFSADLYQGKSEGSLVINAQGKIPTITAHETLTNVQVGTLLDDVSKTSKVKITGLGNLTMNLQTEGQNQAALVRALDGNINFAVTNGTIKNIDVGQQIYATIAHFFKRSAPAATATNQTSFSSLTGTVKISNGIASNNDLLLKSPSLKASGKGSANLANQTINYALNAVAIGSPFGKDILELQQQVGGSIPIIISGNLASPSIRPDYTSMAASVLKGQFRQQIEKRFNDNKLGESIQQGLKGILGG